MENKEILQEAIDKWGDNSQIEMIIEECLELAMALQKYKRNDGNYDEKWQNVHDEIADVKIMIAQAELIFDKELIDERVEFKMNRLKERINKPSK